MSELPSTIYLVRRCECWELKPHWYGVWHYRMPRNGGLIRSFAARGRAEAYAARLERARRDGPPKPSLDPFRCSASYERPLDGLTSFPEGVFDDWLREADLTPPTASTPQWGRCASDWVNWWHVTAPAMTPGQLLHVWKGLDLVRFYEVVEVILEGPP